MEEALDLSFDRLLMMMMMIPMIKFSGLHFLFYFTLISLYLANFKLESDLCEIRSLTRRNVLMNIEKKYECVSVGPIGANLFIFQPETFNLRVFRSELTFLTLIILMWRIG